MSIAWLKSQGVTDDDLKEVMPFSTQKGTKMDPYMDVRDPGFDSAPEPVPEVWSGDGVIRTHEQCLEWAATLNCDVKYPKANELFIDLDTEAAYHRYLILLDRLFKLLPGHVSSSVTPSKSGLPKRHAVVTLDKDYSILERIAMQAILGSDPMRELISLARVRNDENYDTIVCFFEPKDEVLA